MTARNNTMMRGSSPVAQGDVTPGPFVVNLVLRLSEALERDRINYCHWKSNYALERSGNGDNDLDLLIARSDAGRFSEILYALGFKRAIAPVEKRMSGVSDFYGYDSESDKIIHVHAHYRLVLGHDTTKNYHLPIERRYLEASVRGDLLRTPSPEYEFIVFVIRMVLKHFTWDSILLHDGMLKSRERQEFAYLLARIDAERVKGALERDLPYLDVELFQRCAEALNASRSFRTRLVAGLQLRRSLRANARRRPAVETFLRVFRRGKSLIMRRVFGVEGKYRLEGGGTMIALVGGDGAGKSTALNTLYSWSSKTFDAMYAHLGKPAWSPTTVAIRGILKVGQLIGLYPVESSFRVTLQQKSPISPGYPLLLREVCRARDRYRTFVKARRFALNGGLVFFDRFPVPQIQLMDGPQTERFINELMGGSRASRYLDPQPASRLSKYLIKLEKAYYQKMVSPELLAVLRLDPEIAVQRKTDEEAEEVRERSTEVWNANWTGTEAYVIDARRSKEDVAAELKALVWSNI